LEYDGGVSASLRLSVAVITHNEEANLPRCLESVRGLASEIVVIDSGSDDRTGEIARRFGARFKFEPWQGHVAQKNLALLGCTQPWVLCLDADEAVSPELADAIRAVLSAGSPQPDGFYINRRSFYLGQWVRYAWNPEWRLRLGRREKAQWRGHDPHDRLEVDGVTARLTGELLHYSYASLQDHLEQTIRHARTSADSMARAGGRCRWYHLAISPWLALAKRLVLKQGFRDGWRGWIIAYSASFSVLAKYAFLCEKQFQTRKDRHISPVPPTGETSGSKPSTPA
jgi:glycosyltransferase involved in cell wall biosynthesis